MQVILAELAPSPSPSAPMSSSAPAAHQEEASIFAQINADFDRRFGSRPAAASSAPPQPIEQLFEFCAPKHTDLLALARAGGDTLALYPPHTEEEEAWLVAE